MTRKQATLSKNESQEEGPAAHQSGPHGLLGLTLDPETTGRRPQGPAEGLTHSKKAPEQGALDGICTNVPCRGAAAPQRQQHGMAQCPGQEGRWVAWWMVLWSGRNIGWHDRQCPGQEATWVAWCMALWSGKNWGGMPDGTPVGTARRVTGPICNHLIL